MPSPLAEYNLIKSCENYGKQGFSRINISIMLDRSEAWVSQTYSLLNHPDLIDAIKDGKYSF